MCKYSRARLFQDLFALATLFHHFSSAAIPIGFFNGGDPAVSITGVLCELSALLALLYPGRQRNLFFGAMLVSILIDTWCWLPYTTNHTTLASIVSLTLLAHAAVKRRNFIDSIEETLLFLRFEVVTLYVFATFHKLNTGFVSPETSCSLLFYEHIRDTVPLFPPKSLIESLLPWMALVTEGSLALAFAIPRLHRFGILLGLAFHFVLGFDIIQQFYNFSALMFALYALFIPVDVIRTEPFATGSRSRDESLIRVTVAVIAFSVCVLQLLFFHSERAAITFFTLRYVLWWLAAFAIIALFLRFRGPYREGYPKLISGAGAVCLTFAVFNGVTPYLGLKTRSGYDMYSNLSVEHTTTNHFFIRRGLALGGIISDHATIVSTTDPELREKYLTPGYDIVWFELLSRFEQAPQYQTRFKHFDAAYMKLPYRALADGGFPYFLRKLLWFRPVETRNPARCQW